MRCALQSGPLAAKQTALICAIGAGI